LTVAGVEEITNDLISLLPAALIESVGDITIHVAASRSDLAVLRAAVKESGQEAVAIPQDFRAVFLGTPVDPGADLEDEETEGPTGVIILNAAMLRDTQDVLDTLLHEFGHALGFDEDEVAALGLQ
jgi:predicted Zn-dependent protease with MMP-like domain